MNILIVDPVHPVAYDFAHLRQHALGGTESTVLRIARELGRHHRVTLSQRGCQGAYAADGIRYLPDAQGLELRTPPDVVIVIRKFRRLSAYRQRYPDARLLLWAHNYQNAEILFKRHHVARSGATVICVSREHRAHMDRLLNGAASWPARLLGGAPATVAVDYAYNLIDPDFVPGDGSFQPNKLFFFSTANKGLDQVLDHFAALRRIDAGFRLYIANNTAVELAAYKLDRETLDSDAVTVLGKLARNDVIRHLRESLCVFYPQNRYPETFGLVYVEANSVGTPVLAHPFGSAREVIDNDAQFVDAADREAVIQTVLRWRDGERPTVGRPAHLSTAAIMRNWERLLSGATAP